MPPNQLGLHPLRLSALPFFRSLLVGVVDQDEEDTIKLVVSGDTAKTFEPVAESLESVALVVAHPIIYPRCRRVCIGSATGYLTSFCASGRNGAFTGAINSGEGPATCSPWRSNSARARGARAGIWLWASPALTAGARLGSRASHGVASRLTPSFGGNFPTSIRSLRAEPVVWAADSPSPPWSTPRPSARRRARSFQWSSPYRT